MSYYIEALLASDETAFTIHRTGDVLYACHEVGAHKTIQAQSLSENRSPKNAYLPRREASRSSNNNASKRRQHSSPATHLTLASVFHRRQFRAHRELAGQADRLKLTKRMGSAPHDMHKKACEQNRRGNTRGHDHADDAEDRSHFIALQASDKAV
jgi:hypothetical protein